MPAKLLSQLKRTLGENLFVKAAGDINTSQVLPLRGINLTGYLCDMHNLKFRMNLRTTTNKNVKLLFSNACNLAVTFLILTQDPAKQLPKLSNMFADMYSRDLNRLYVELLLNWMAALCLKNIDTGPCLPLCNIFF